MRCNLCPRMCNTDRANSVGDCGVGMLARVAKHMLHHWEEPCISGTVGSGAVFFSGCNLGCVFCQNHALQSGAVGTDYTASELAELMLELQSLGAHNINLVTPTPHLIALRKAIRKARELGLTIPIVYNTGGYERVEAVRALTGLIDVYLPDLKYVSPVLSKAFSMVENYFAFAAPALEEMYRQVGTLQLDDNGLAQRGMLVRHLVLPNCLDDSRRVIDYLSDAFPKSLHLSIMRQYTPTERTLTPPLNRKLTDREYDRILTYALDAGFSNILMQHKSSATLDYTPLFTNNREK